MDFKQEFIAFEEFLKTHQLSAISQLMWYKMAVLSYSATCQEWVEVSSTALMVQLKIKDKEVFKSNIDELVKCGLITIKKGKDNDLFRYKLNHITKELTN